MDDLLDTVAVNLEALFKQNSDSTPTSHQAILDSIFEDVPTKATQAFSAILSENISGKFSLNLTDHDFSIFVVAAIKAHFKQIIEEKQAQKHSLQNHMILQMIWELADQFLNPKLCQPAFQILWEAVSILITSLHSSLHSNFAIEFTSRVKTVLDQLVKEAKQQLLSKQATLKLEYLTFQRLLRLMQILGHMVSLACDEQLFKRDEEPLQKLLIECFEMIIFLGKELIQEYQHIMPIYSKTSQLKSDSPHVDQIIGFTLEWVNGILLFLRNIELSSNLFAGVRQFFISNQDIVQILKNLATFDNEVPSKKLFLDRSLFAQRRLITHQYKQQVNNALNEIRLKTLQIVSILLLVEQEVEMLSDEEDQEQSSLHQALPEIVRVLTEGLYTYFLSLDSVEEREDESRLFYLNPDQSPQIYEIVLHSVMIIRTSIRLTSPKIIQQLDLFKQFTVGVVLPLFVTTPKERETMLEDPHQFTLLQEDICNSQTSMNLKSQAAKLLENLVDNCYEMKLFVLSFMLELLKSATNPNLKLSLMLKFKQYPIVAVLPSKIQLDLALMVFSILSYLFEEMEPLVAELDSQVSLKIDLLIGHPFLVIRAKFLLLLECVYDLLFQHDQVAQNKAIKFIIACYSQQVDCESKSQADLLQLMGIGCFHEVINCQRGSGASLEPHMGLIFESILHNIEHCEHISFFQHLDEHLKTQVTSLVETKLSDITDTSSDTALILEILHSYALRLASDQKGECFLRAHQSFKSFFSDKHYEQIWKLEGILDKIEPWGQCVFEISYEQVSEEIVLTLALALGRCNYGTNKSNQESLQFLRYLMKYLEYHLKKQHKEGILKPSGMKFIESLCHSETFTDKIDSEFQQEGGFVQLIIGKLGFDLMEIGRGSSTRTFEEGATVLLDVLMVGFVLSQTSGEKMEEQFMTKMLEFFSLRKVHNDVCKQLISYCYMGCAISQPSLCLKYLGSNRQMLRDFSDTALATKHTLHEHGLCAIGISMLLKQPQIGDRFELGYIVRLLAALIKSVKEMKRITDFQKEEESESESEEDKEESKELTVEEQLNFEQGYLPMIGYFQKSQIYTQMFNSQEALASLKTAADSLISDPKIDHDKLKEGLGKSNLQDLDDLMHSVMVNKQVRRVFRATRKTIDSQPLKMIEEMAKK